MKKKMILVLFAALGLFACRKEDQTAVNPGSGQKAQKNLKTIQDKSSLQESILIFNTLTNQEKADVWRLHLSNMKESLDLNQNQKDLIQSSIDFLTGDAYENPDEYANLGEFHRITAQANLLFSELLRKQIFNTLDDFLPAAIGGNPGNGGYICECNLKHDFCGVGETGSNRSRCVRVACHEGPGCGWFFLQNCSGICRILPRN